MIVFIDHHFSDITKITIVKFVIKEYINPNFQEKEKEKEKSLNQQIMTEIRNFCNNKIIKKN